jgi:hypothetical protein
LSKELDAALGIGNDYFWTEMLALKFYAADDSMGMGRTVEEVEQAAGHIYIDEMILCCTVVFQLVRRSQQ